MKAILYKTDDEKGNLVDIERAVTARNWLLGGAIRGGRRFRPAARPLR